MGQAFNYPSSPLTQSIVTSALEWGYYGGAVSSTELRQIANYLIWLTSPYFQTAQYIISNTSGGGSVVPPSSTTIAVRFHCKCIFTYTNRTSGLSIPAYAGWNLNFQEVA